MSEKLEMIDIDELKETGFSLAEIKDNFPDVLNEVFPKPVEVKYGSEIFNNSFVRGIREIVRVYNSNAGRFRELEMKKRNYENGKK